MNFYEALDAMKRGEEVQHAGKTYRLMHHGVHDVTDAENPERLNLTEADWDALSSSETVVPETIAPEAVDEVLSETAPETTDEVIHETALDEEHPDSL